MKDVIYFVVFVAACVWIYNRCTSDDSKEVEKQVKVAVKTANLRTGPGTSYDVLTDSTGNKIQVTQGTLLNVTAEEKGWYRISIEGTDQPAYIKQSLCTAPNAKTTKGKRRLKSSGNAGQPVSEPAGEPAAASSPQPATAVPSSSSASSDEFEEEVEEAPFIPKTR